MEERSVTLPDLEPAVDGLGFFRWGRIGDSIVATNDAGEWALLNPVELDELLGGSVVEGHARFEEFQSKGFIRDGLDLDALAARMAKRSGHVRRGPYLHVVTVTNRTNGGNGQSAGSDLDMSTATAEKVADFALQGSSPAMTVEFRAPGGEPLLNFEAIRHFVEHAQDVNQKTAGKKLRFFVVSNLSGMTEEIAEWMISKDVRLSTQLDGPEAIHDAGRDWSGAASHADVVRWIELFARRYGELERDPDQWRVEAHLHVTRQTLPSASDVVEEYAKRGLRTIHLRPLDPARFDQATWTKVGCDTSQYLDFYRAVFDATVERNRNGGDIAEGLAVAVATKILSEDDPGIVDVQSPSGLGSGLLAYETDGRVFPCEEAQTLNAAGDPTFLLGSVDELSASQLPDHPTVRALAAASLLDSHPMYATRWNKPYCGINPVRNYIAQGDLFGQRSQCFEARILDQVCTRLFEMLADDKDTSTREMVQSWAARRAPETIDRRATA